jgi:uncharacterized protein (DUF433 family)
MEWRDRITTDPEILAGKPVIKGTRISVELIVGRLADGWSIEAVLESYPPIVHADILATLGYAAARLREDDYIRLPNASQ